MSKKLKTLYTITFLVVLNTGFSQNLVMNPSFEDYTQCPDNGGQTDYLNNVTNPTWQSSSSPDFFSTCGSMGYGLPNTMFGNVNAKTGNNCTGIGTYTPNTDAREYIQMKLISPLIQGESYEIRFFVALVDSVQYSAYNFGAYLTPNPIDTNTFFNLYRVPQITNPSTNLLDQRAVWTEISASYLATGGEQYIILGNFNDNASTSSVFLGGASWGNLSFYLIDDVSIILDSNNSIEEINTYYFKAYLQADKIKIESNSDAKKIISLYNCFGEIVYTDSFLEIEKNIDITSFQNGIYFIQLKAENHIINKKVIINH